MTQRNEDELSYEIIGAAIEVHRTLGGPGLLEGIYESSLLSRVNVKGVANPETSHYPRKI